MLKLELALKQVRADLEKLNQGSGSKGRWVDLTKPFAAIVACGKLDGRGAATFKDGVFQMEGEDPRLLVPVKSADVIFSVEIIKTKGLYASVAGRVTETGSYWTRMAIYDVLSMHRWTKDTGGLELVRKTVKQAFAGKFAKIQLAILGDTQITFVEGKEVMRIKNSDVKGLGHVSIGVRAATVRFRNPKYLVPSAKLTKQLLAGQAAP
jgi:hypothetical protein